MVMLGTSFRTRFFAGIRAEIEREPNIKHVIVAESIRNADNRNGTSVL